MTVTILTGDCREKLRELEEESVQCCVTSPPYWGLRDYGLPALVWGHERCWHGGEHEWGEYERPGMSGGITSKKAQIKGCDNFQIVAPSTAAFCQRCDAWRGSLGLEPSPDLYVAHLVEVFREVKRVLRKDGVVWLNIGDRHAPSAAGTNEMESVTWEENGKVKKQGMTRTGQVPGLKAKQLVMIPFRVALALQADGWWVRQDVIWAKGRDGDVGENGYGSSMPESAEDRPISSHEYVFLLSKSARYYYDTDAVQVEWDGGSHRLRSVWLVNPKGFKQAHFATFPPALVETCIKAGTSERGCCPECGAAWGRVVDIERTRDPTRHTGRAAVGNNDRQDGDWPRMIKEAVTTGWQPTCNCGIVVDSGALDPNMGTGIDIVQPHDPVPCTVLDPFFGAGTTGLVADRLGRDCIGIELNEEYAEMARQRITADAPMFANVV